MPMDVLWIWPEIKHKPNFKNFVKDHGYTIAKTGSNDERQIWLLK